MEPTDSELKDFAVHHVAYEIDTLVDQVDHLDQYGDDSVIQRALVEASLAHIRLLDDFFKFEKAGRRDDEVVAQHYVSTWDCVKLLSRSERRDVNAQLPHLAMRRRPNYDWRLGHLTARACAMFVKFVDRVRAADPTHAAWFDKPYQKAAGVAARRSHYDGMPSTSTTETNITVTIFRNGPDETNGNAE